MDPQPILTNTNLEVLTSGNKVMLRPQRQKSPHQIPSNMHEINDMIAMIDMMKEWNKQMRINMKTGGPIINKTFEMLKLLRLSMSKEDIETMRKEIYAEAKEFNNDKLEDFKKVIIETYFSLTDFSKNQFLKNEPNYKLWTTASWEEFKTTVFHDFTKDNFLKCHLKFDMIQIPNDISKVQNIRILNDQFFMVHIHTCKYKGDIPSYDWRWENIDEYKRLHIPGKIIYRTKCMERDNGNMYYWIPLILDDTRQTIGMVPYSSKERKFAIDDQSVNNIIALAPFNIGTNEIALDDIITDVLFDQSYLCQILKIIDKTLNDVMKEILSRYSLTCFYDFEKKF